jgi:hypothetical protein
MSGILAAQGVSVLSDERTILQKIGDDFHIFGTPWVGASSYAANRSGPLTSVFCLRHGQGTHCLTPMTSTALTRFLLQQAFLPHWDRDALQGALTAIGTLSECVEAADLAFLKNPNVFKFLRAYRRTRTVGAA